MKKPPNDIILFDYGQTFISEERFGGIAGTKAVLNKCVSNLGQ
jgi:hypothetical protein